ncbi:hypothetical protein [Marinobacterium sp. BA1]|uniref:hypothetical protein n=1 Tax=Marinobacterium sp. BA1 TaxID=3138931 RepID=UPI0032E606E3
MVNANASVQQLVYAKDSQAALRLATTQHSVPSVFLVFQDDREDPIVTIADRNHQLRICDGEYEPFTLREHLHNTAVGSPEDGKAYMVVWDIDGLAWEQAPDKASQAQQIFTHVLEPALRQRQQGTVIADLPCSQVSLEILDLKEAITLVQEEHPQRQPDPLAPALNDAHMQPS